MIKVTPAGERIHYITLWTLGPAVPDGQGGFTQTPIALDPPDAWAKVAPATARDLERVTSGTVQSEASHIVTMPYHPGVDTKTQIVFGTRVFHVAGVSNPEERNVETIAICTEVVA